MEEKTVKSFEVPELAKVVKVYVGKPHTCMCGCAGRYTYPKCNQEFGGTDRGYSVGDEEVDDKRATRILNKVKKNAHLGIEVLDNYIYTVIVGKTQYTVYMKQE